MDLPERKSNRLKYFDYSQNGVYFITICTYNRKPILSRVIDDQPVGNAVLGIPKIELLKYGIITEKIINQLNEFYEDINIDNYVIMPNHLHLLISVDKCGAPRTTHPTISNYIGTLKRFINKEIGENIWQKSFYDHIVRDDEDYQQKYQYIDENPIKWDEDELNIKAK